MTSSPNGFFGSFAQFLHPERLNVAAKIRDSRKSLNKFFKFFIRE
jgi:hypothetical protein